MARAKKKPEVEKKKSQLVTLKVTVVGRSKLKILSARLGRQMKDVLEQAVDAYSKTYFGDGGGQ